MPTSSQKWLLIARKDGSSGSRRQRHFPNADAVTRAFRRWRAEGFNTWWLRDPGGPLTAIPDSLVSLCLRDAP
jgi:hypothetical protein